MFLGQHLGQLKDPNLVCLPLNWRRSISGAVYLTQGFDHNLLILTEETFQEIYLRITALNLTDPRARLLSRMLLGRAVLLEIDQNGNLALPAGLMDYADVTGEFVLVGQGSYLEVWSPDAWHQQQAEINDTQANAQRFSTFVISTR